jgi:hypothetical protein
MADPLKVLRSLDRLADQYTVFEPDQVLTHSQLNSLSAYLDDQDRLTRVALLGVGLVGGLRVGRQGGAVRVTRGLGVTTDGDLLMLGTDTLYDRWRPYDTTAPVYEPFYRGRPLPRPDSPTETVTETAIAPPGEMIELQELVPVGESDVLALPLARLPGTGLDDKVVLMLMESVVNDPDLCSGTDCDNLGRDALHRVRLLLIGRRDAAVLMRSLPALAPASERAQALPELTLDRPALGRDIVTTSALAARYRTAARAALDRLIDALRKLQAAFPELLDEMFGADPSAGWVGTLRAQAAAFERRDNGLQPWFAFVGDLVETWNGLREALLADDGVMLPDVQAFPKHLLLGALAAPREWRTGLFPAPLDTKAREAAAHARFLAWKLHVLVQSFVPPEDTALRVTPSFGPDRRLEERAIPWHYALREDLPVQVGWNYRLSARNQGGHNLGYRAAAWAQTDRARTPLQFAIGAHDFFRVEGHLGRPVEEVSAELKRLIAQHNLPFEVQPVLLHNDRRRIRVKPGIRYTELHRMHYLVRKDVAWRLDESKTFGDKYLADVTEAVSQRQILGTAGSGESVIGAARAARDAVSTAQAQAAPALGQMRYTAYKSDSAANARWKASYTTTLESVGNARVNLGNVSRADFVSPFDSLIATNQPHWIDWLDDLIQAGDERADEALLFPAFVQRHPGLDHLGGAWRGGTLVLVYDDAGRVVADFTLAYPCAEEDRAEPEEPPLTRPTYRPPTLVDKGIRVVKPLDLQIEDRFVAVRTDWQKDLVAQTAGIEGLVKGVTLPSKGAGSVVPGKDFDTGDLYLDHMVRDLEYKRRMVDELSGLMTQPGLTPEVRTQVEGDLKRAQGELAGAVGDVTNRVVTERIDVASPAAAEVTQVLNQSLGSIRDTEARSTLDTRLTTLETQATGNQLNLVGNLRKLGGLGR